MADFFPGFEERRIATSGTEIHLVTGGSGPPLLLLHGYPQTHVLWRKVAPRLAQDFTLVIPDLRGYGDSAKPPAGADHAAYSKRALAQDQVETMAALGHERFCVAGHDRGARVTHRLIGAQAEYYLRHSFGLDRNPAALEPEVFAEYLRCFSNPETIRATCDEYRAGAGIDLEHDRADRGRKITTPLLVLWGQRSGQGSGYDVLAVWREHADNVTGQAIASGHFLPEEAPDDTYRALRAFFA